MFVLLFVLAIHVPPGDACSPLSRDTSTPYFLCCFEYVISGIIVKDSRTGVPASSVPGNMTTAAPTPSFSGRVYTVQLTAVYKGYDENSLMSSIELRTATDDGLCGVDLTLQQEYLLAGESKGYIYFTDWNQLRTRVPGSFTAFLPSLRSCVGVKERVGFKLFCRTNFSGSSLTTSRTSAIPMPSTSMPSSLITSTPTLVTTSVITPNTSLYTPVFTPSPTSVSTPAATTTSAVSPSVSNSVLASVLIFLFTLK